MQWTSADTDAWLRFTLLCTTQTHTYSLQPVRDGSNLPAKRTGGDDATEPNSTSNGGAETPRQEQDEDSAAYGGPVHGFEVRV